MRKKSMVIVGLVSCAMMGVVTAAATPGLAALWSAKAPTIPVSSLGAGTASRTVAPDLDSSNGEMFDAAPANFTAKTPGAYTMAQASIPIPAAGGSYMNAQPNPVVESLIDGPSSGGAVLPPPVKIDVSNSIFAAGDCTRYGLKTKAPLPLEKLVTLIQIGVSRAGPNASVEGLRLRIQAYLNLSHDPQDVKTEAVAKLRTLFAPGSTAQQALADPFDLTEVEAIGQPNDYDPCGNPTAIGGYGAFSPGPYANVFVTINPIPVVVTKAVAVTEGQ